MAAVRSPRAIPVAVLAVAVLVAGCGDDEPVPADEPPALTQTVAPPTTTAPERAPAQTQTQTQTQTTAAEPGCGAIGELRLRRVAGQAGCDEIRRVAAGYDLAGAKVQELAGWTCASATAQTRPVVFTCTRGGAEFTASESG